jgi:hypothetical protein
MMEGSEPAWIMPELHTESKWFQDRKTAETNLNEIAGFKAAVWKLSQPAS